MNIRAVYPGTFDPITLGHIDVIRRASALLDKLVIGVAINRDKGPMFSLDERVAMIEAECAAVTSATGVEIVAHPFENLLIDNRVGLLCLVPGHKETLRIAGRGRIAADENLRAQFAINERLPDLVLVVDVEQVFMHCSKSLVRSRLWSPETWGRADAAPTLAQWVKSTVNTDETLEQVQGNHDRDRETRLY